MGNSSLGVTEWAALTLKQPPLWQHLHPCSSSPHTSPRSCCSVSIYLSLPAFCLPSFPQLIYGHRFSARGHCSLNLAIMCDSLWRPSICGASMQPDGLHSSSSIFPAKPVHPSDLGQLHMCCWWPLSSHPGHPHHPHRSLLSWDVHRLCLVQTSKQGLGWLQRGD